MDKDRIKGPAKQAKGSGKETAKLTGVAKVGAKGNAEKALGKGRGALGSKKDKLSNDFST
jgi:uncharacterized protein YjbJ (UPF0337 family)